MASGMDMAEPKILQLPLLLPSDWYQGHRQIHSDQRVVCGGGNWPWIDMGDRSWVEQYLDSKDLKFYQYDCTPQQSALNPTHTESKRIGSGIPHRQIPALYAGAIAAWDWYGCNRERELAITTRTVEYLYCGVPVFYPTGLELSDFIEKHKLGILLSDYRDLQGVDNLQGRLLQARENLSVGLENLWDQEAVCEGLTKFIKNPRPRAKAYGGIAELEAEKRLLVQKNQALLDENEHLIKVQKKLLSDLSILKEEKSELAFRWQRDIKRLSDQKTG
jgi:hypothetical protein